MLWSFLKENVPSFLHFLFRKKIGIADKNAKLNQQRKYALTQYL